MATSWQATLAAGKVLVIDGGMGTELQRRGVPMDEVAWSGTAVLSHPEVVRAVHEDYIRAGADVIITNTFGSTRQMLGGAGFGAQVEEVHRRAVALAKEARAAPSTGSRSPAHSRQVRRGSIVTPIRRRRRNWPSIGNRRSCWPTAAWT